MSEFETTTPVEVTSTVGRRRLRVQRQANRIAEAALRKAKKVREAADSLRQHDLSSVTERIDHIVNRYPARALATAAMGGFLLAHILLALSRQ